MCGVCARVHFSLQRSDDFKDQLIKLLKQEQSCGSDSAGIAINNDAFGVRKVVGTVDQLSEHINGLSLSYGLQETLVGIGHVRTAHIGPATFHNAHPHASEGDEFWVVHAGYISNYISLKGQLEEADVSFLGDTDSEAVAKLVKSIFESLSPRPSFPDLVRKVIDRLEGDFALIFMSRVYPRELVATCRDHTVFILDDAPRFILTTSWDAIRDSAENLDQNRIYQLKEDEVVHIHAARLDNYERTDDDTHEDCDDDSSVATED